MSNTYCVVPLHKDCADWLDEEEVIHPPPSSNYRSPTLADIEQVLSSLEGYVFSIRRCVVTIGWIADISSANSPNNGPWTELVLDEDAPQGAFSFSGGWRETIFTIIERLSQICGPFAVADGANAKPYLVVPGLPLEKILTEYESR
jgi:hypothetical protein